MKLEFSSLNGLLHAALTYLCDEDCIIPGGANLPTGTRVNLEMSWPEGEEPIVVKGISRGLDPAGRGLRLDIEDPGALHQIVMIMTHLHFGPYVGQQLLSMFQLQPRDPDEELTLPPRAAEAVVAAKAPVIDEAAVVEAPARETPSTPDDNLRTALPQPKRAAPPRPKERPSVVRPPRLRPPVIRPPTVRPPAMRTELPQLSGADRSIDHSLTALAVDPELVAGLDDLDDDY